MAWTHDRTSTTSHRITQRKFVNIPSTKSQYNPILAQSYLRECLLLSLVILQTIAAQTYLTKTFPLTLLWKTYFGRGAWNSEYCKTHISYHFSWPNRKQWPMIHILIRTRCFYCVRYPTLDKVVFDLRWIIMMIIFVHKCEACVCIRGHFFVSITGYELLPPMHLQNSFKKFERLANVPGYSSSVFGARD